MPELNKFLIIAGIVLMLLGALLTFTPLGLGRLPGDIVVVQGTKY